METPNPENIVVATCNFHIDPTHRKPIPPLLLSFVAEFAGFARVKTLRLQEPAEMHSPETQLGLMDVLWCASPDYAIVAQKNGPQAVLQCNEAPFHAQYGITTQELARRYDQQPRLKTEIIRWVESILRVLKPRDTK